MVRSHFENTLHHLDLQDRLVLVLGDLVFLILVHHLNQILFLYTTLVLLFFQ
nr:MAG TPA: hypothetical protein [Caudoviricetes sp.]